MRTADSSTERSRAVLDSESEGVIPELPPIEAYDSETAIKLNGHRETRRQEHTEEKSLIWLRDFTVRTYAGHVVQDLIPADSLVVIFGDSGSGKSTLMLDLLFSVAHGLPFRGLKTMKGLVVYVSGEGCVGVEHRGVAWCKEHPDVSPGVFAMWPDAVNFRSTESVLALIERIETAESQIGEKCAVVAVDTLTRCLFGSDNDPEHMAGFISACDLVRRRVRCSIIVVHHSGKDITKGARGHSMLRAAADVEIEVTGADGLRWAVVKKQRDIAKLPAMGFEIVPVHLGRDADGRDISACVIDHRDLAQPPKKPSGRRQVQLISRLKELAQSAVGVWPQAEIVKIAVSLGFPRSSANATVIALLENGFLKRTVGGLTL